MAASDVIALCAIVVAIVSVVVAVVANARAKDALDLQKRIDAREREFRDVTWSLSWSPWTGPSEKPALQLTNSGLTTATNVTLMITLPSSQQALRVGTIEPGETRTLEVEYDRPGPAHNHIELIRDPAYRLHWSSPLGHPDEVRATARDFD